MQSKIWIGTLAAALMISLAWGFNEYRLADGYRLVAENNNQRALVDFAGHIDQMETDMAKGEVVSNPNQRILYLSQISDKGDAALKDFAQIPADKVGLSYISQFLNQSGDFARTLAQRIAGGGTISPEEEKNLRTIHERLMPINQKVQEIMNRRDTENLAWTTPAPSLWQRMGVGKPRIAEAAAGGANVPYKSVSSGLEQLDASLQKLPPSSYSGEYATRVVAKPLGLPSGQVSREQALVAARDFLNKVGYHNVTPEFVGESKGALGGYMWKYKDINVEISRQGGVVTHYNNKRAIGPKTLSIEKASNKAETLLKVLGLPPVITSSEDFGSYVQFDAVYETSGVMIYPDKVHLMIALDNGQLIGLDSTPYYSFHHTRSFPAKISLDSALRKVRANFKVTESRLAVIAKPGNKEIYCYEFRGRYQGEEYLLYLNAATGAEEQVQRIIKTPRGEFLQ